jgi:TolB-like protein
MKKAIIVVALFMVGVGAFSQEEKPIVVIAPFTAVGGPSANEVNVVTELLTSQLVSQGRITIVDRSNFDRVITEMQFSLSDWANDSKAAKIGKALNAQYIIRGQLMQLGNQYFLSATMLDIERLELVASAQQQFSNLGQILVVF